MQHIGALLSINGQTLVSYSGLYRGAGAKYSIWGFFILVGSGHGKSLISVPGGLMHYYLRIQVSPGPGLGGTNCECRTPISNWISTT